MAHFAKIDANGIVEQVIVVADTDTADSSGAATEAIGVAFCQKLLIIKRLVPIVVAEVVV